MRPSAWRRASRPSCSAEAGSTAGGGARSHAAAGRGMRLAHAAAQGPLCALPAAEAHLHVPMLLPALVSTPAMLPALTLFASHQALQLYTSQMLRQVSAEFVHGQRLWVTKQNFAIETGR